MTTFRNMVQMSIEETLKIQLENEAWNLCKKLNKIVETTCIGRPARSTPSVYKERLLMAHSRAYERFKRRQSTLFDYNPKANPNLTTYNQPTNTIYYPQPRNLSNVL